MIPSCVPLSLELRAFCRCTPAQVTTRSLTRRGAWVVEGTAYRTHSSYPGYVAASSQYTRSLVPSYLPLLSSLLSSSPLIPPLYPLYLLVSKPIHSLSSPPIFPSYLPRRLSLLSSHSISSSLLFPSSRRSLSDPSFLSSFLPLLSSYPLPARYRFVPSLSHPLSASPLVLVSYPHLCPSLLSSSPPLSLILILSPSPSLCFHLPLSSFPPLFPSSLFVSSLRPLYSSHCPTLLPSHLISIFALSPILGVFARFCSHITSHILVATMRGASHSDFTVNGLCVFSREA